MTGNTVTFDMPGTDVEAEVNPGLVEQMQKKGAIAILWSPWGVEGLYDNVNALADAITSIRKMAAYRDERITVEVKNLNGPV